ncbi:helix-turn-helix domain-containing protein [Mycolicibacterium sphagni]|uniref:helix-turn-helix domain-containing protein n=1 Tax=Mycolicibacterium sphagni TaxID=1786 RepID=UPI0021F38A7C|nr:helix-turn-helix transcriptional regulator [Mycolicibacterium sphagni]MCV7175704.1 helix-turn-helix transcriptional regulator [Mycolicibacterium sphagni]
MVKSSTQLKPEDLQQSLGDRLEKSLNLSGYSIGDMAEYLEVHRNTVSGWINERTIPAPIYIRTWADMTGVPVEWLKTGEWPQGEAPKPRKTRRTQAK